MRRVRSLTNRARVSPAWFAADLRRGGFRAAERCFARAGELVGRPRGSLLKGSRQPVEMVVPESQRDWSQSGMVNALGLGNPVAEQLIGDEPKGEI